MHKVSVLMSVHNDESNVGNAIESILNQTYEDFEFLILDDCSTDDTFPICKNFQKTDKRIKLFKNPKNIGLTKSLNRLIEESSGEFIARQDSDDKSYSNRLMVQCAELSNVNVSGCTTLAKIKNQNKVIPGFSRYIPPSVSLKYKNPFVHGSLMIKTEDLKKIGLYDERFYFSQDYKLMKDLINKNINIKIINKVLYELNMLNNISTLNKEQQAYYAACVKKNKIP